MRLIADLYHPQIAFLPIGDLYTMSPKEVAKACELARAGETVLLRGGIYRETLRPRRDGVIIRAMPGETVIISGADAIEGWGRNSDGSWSAPLRREPSKLGGYN